MKIALFHNGFFPPEGGIEYQMRGLAKALKRAGHQVTIIVSSAGDELVDGIRVIRLPVFSVSFIRGTLDPRIPKLVKNIIQNEKFDIIHSHLTGVSPVALSALAVAMQSHIPAVATYHSIPRIEASFHPWLKKWIDWQSQRCILTGVSPVVCEYVCKLLKVEKVSCLPNGIDVSQWKYPRKTHERNRLNIVSSIRFTPRKRPLALIKILNKVRNALPPTIKLNVTLIGEGILEPAIKSMIRWYGLSTCVELPGWLSQEDLKRKYSESDLFVLPSIYESFGLAALEARCSGLPVIARAGWGPSSFIKHGKEGLLGNSDQELAEHIIYLAKNENFRQQIMNFNINNTPSYDWSTVLTIHNQIYQKAFDILL